MHIRDSYIPGDSLLKPKNHLAMPQFFDRAPAKHESVSRLPLDTQFAEDDDDDDALDTVHDEFEDLIDDYESAEVDPTFNSEPFDPSKQPGRPNMNMGAKSEPKEIDLTYSESLPGNKGGEEYASVPESGEVEQSF